MCNYEKALIYKWVCDDCDDIYIGSTINFTRRKQTHKKGCNNPEDKHHHYKVYQKMREYGGFGNWKMIQIETYPCKSKRELESREEYWRKELKATLNSNSCFLTPLDKKEYKKQYYEANKEERKEYYKQYSKQHYASQKEVQKQYYEANKEEKKEYQKQYREANKDEIKEYQKQYREKKRNEKHTKLMEKNSCN